MKMDKFFGTLFFLIFFSGSLINALPPPIDLEKDMLQNFVIESKKITIPGYPYGFNPAILRWRGEILMVFRAGKDPSYSPSVKKGYHEEDSLPSDNNSTEEEASEQSDYHDTFKGHYETPLEPELTISKDPQWDSPNRMVMVWLDEKFNPISKPQILDVPNHNASYRQQDPRIVCVADRLYMIYSDFVGATEVPETRRMFVLELKYEKNKFSVKTYDPLNHFPGEIEKRWEKNWAPFDYKGNLLLAYSINPHKIMRPLFGKLECELFCSSEKNVNWDWGHLRGGTPALLNDDGNYLAFFHSSKEMFSVQSKNKKMSHYFMGAYLFSGKPPFELKKMSPTPIIGENYYNGPLYDTWKPLRVVFPGGYIMDKNYVWISYGRQDHEIWITKLDKKELMKSLVSVSP